MPSYFIWICGHYGRKFWERRGQPATSFDEDDDAFVRKLFEINVPGFEDDVDFEGAALRGEIVGLGIVVVDKAYKNIITSMSPEQKAMFQKSFHSNFGFVFVLNRFAYSAKPGTPLP